MWKSLKMVPKSMHLKTTPQYIVAFHYGIFNLMMYSNLDQKNPSAPNQLAEKLVRGIELGFLLMSKFEQWPSGWPKIEADSPHGRHTLIPIHILVLIQIETDGQSAASSGWCKMRGACRMAPGN